MLIVENIILEIIEMKEYNKPFGRNILNAKEDKPVIIIIIIIGKTTLNRKD